MPKEIERKFLVLNDAFKNTAEKEYYKQGYLSTDKERTVRVRIIGNRGFITIKGITKSICREEYEFEIPIAEAHNILDNICLKPIIEKYRYKYQYEGLTWEIDEFMNENQGLIIAEVELPDENYPVIKPQWIGKEVSDDPRYYNSNLIQSPYNTW